MSERWLRWSDALPRSRKDIEAYRRAHGTVASNTLEWYECRRGRVTASAAAAQLMSDDIDDWRALAAKLEEEMDESYQRRPVDSHAFAWGHKYEPEALAALAKALKVDVIEPGLVLHEMHDTVSATPDGYIGEDTTVQVKCLNKAEHLTCLNDGTIQHKYYVQTQFESWVSRRQKILYVGFHPQLSKTQRLAIIDIPVDEKMHEEFETRLFKFRLYFEGIEQWPVKVRQVSATGGIPVTSLF